MFRLSNIKFHNICQYDDMDTPITVGLLAVCGRNGSGKTTLLRGLVYGLTGLVDGSWGTQTSLQKDGTADPGYVELTLSSDVSTLVIRRFSTSSIKSDFADCVTEIKDGVSTLVAQRRKSVDSYLQNIYGISCQLLFQICWGRQGQMDSLLTAPSAFINTFLSSVFDTKFLSLIRDKIKLQLDTVAQLSGACIDEEQKAQIKLSGLKPLDILIKNIKEAEQHLNEASDVYMKHTEAVSSGLPREEKEAQEHSLRVKIKHLQDEISSLEATVEPPVCEYTKEELLRSLDELNNNIPTYSSSKYDAQTQKATLERTLTEVKEHLSSLQKLHEEVEAKLAIKDTVCHLCKGHIADEKAYYQERCVMLTGIPTVEEYREHFDACCAEHTKSIEDLTSQIGKLEADIEQYTTQLSDAVKLKQDISKLMEAHMLRSTWEAGRDRCAEYKEMEALLEKELARVSSITVIDSEAVQRGLVLKKAWVEAKQTHQQAVDEYTSTKANSEFLQMSIKENHKQAEQYGINKEAREVLTKIRDLLSQSRVQARYLHSKILELNKRIQDLMDKTDMPFSLFLNPETHVFEYTTLQGFTHPAAHLSGAQKNISAVILQMAILEVVQPRINLFLVDEPSESLDNENKIIMADLFQRMNRMLPSIDGVMLIVSRDEQLIDSCENVLNVSAT